MKNFNVTKWITTTALMMALVIASGFIPRVPTPVGNIYWCDSVIIISAFLLDPLASFLAGGVSMLIYDLLAGSAYMAVPSMFIHGLQAVVISVIMQYVFPKKDTILKAILAALAGMVIVVVGYFTYRMSMAGWEMANAVTILSTKTPGNLMQEGIGIVVSVVVVYVLGLKKALQKNNLLPVSIFTLLHK